MAAELASGEAALVRAAFPQLVTGDVVQQMVKTSAPIAGHVPLRLDASAAVGKLVVGGGGGGSSGGSGGPAPKGRP